MYLGGGGEGVKTLPCPKLRLRAVNVLNVLYKDALLNQQFLYLSSPPPPSD